MEESEWFRTLGAPGLPCGLDDLRRVASAQCGLVTRQQCLAARLSSKAIEVRLASGRWRRIQHGVYQTAPGREDWWSSALAAHLACGPDAAWSHRTAAFVWGLLPQPPRTLELLVPRDFAVRPPRGTIVRRSRHLDDRVDQLWWPWVTTVEDTILDIAHAATIDELFALLGRALPASADVGDGGPGQTGGANQASASASPARGPGRRRGWRGERDGAALSAGRRAGAWTAPRPMAAPFGTWTTGAPRCRLRRATSSHRTGRPAWP